MADPLRVERTTAGSEKSLIVLGCSATKLQIEGEVPAISLYDGPTFRVLRSFLRGRRWPTSLSIAVLSAQHGLIGGISSISNYDLRMTAERATELHGTVTDTLKRFVPFHRHVELILGKDYLRSVDVSALVRAGATLHIADGPIGMKLHRLRYLLHALPSVERRQLPRQLQSKRPLYFLPDWDDFLDPDYDFPTDSFSAEDRAGRNEQHSITLMRPDKLCDGILVSLAQHLGTKGLLRRVDTGGEGSLAPRSVRRHFSLRGDQWAFGDCGAFSYVGEDEPTISVEQAVSLYELYDFDLGASVDHIPLPEVPTPDGPRKLTRTEQRARVRLTKDNAHRFIDLHSERRCSFIPVGVIQGLEAKDYGDQTGEYVEMGYLYLALGGLVPRSDAEVQSIVEAVVAAGDKCRHRPALHLLGIFRPALQKKFRQMGIASFDSASYFRKAWLRSSQNYLGTDGVWYSAIRVPPSHDPRTLQRLRKSRVSIARIKALESRALTALYEFDKGHVKLETCLEAVLEYDRLLARAPFSDEALVADYQTTLETRPWRQCGCTMCSQLGIDVLIFRGTNRNKRRGAHNTLHLFRQVAGSGPRRPHEC